MCHVCWNPDPAQRYKMRHVVSYLKFLSDFEEGEADNNKASVLQSIPPGVSDEPISLSWGVLAILAYPTSPTR